MSEFEVGDGWWQVNGTFALLLLSLTQSTSNVTLEYLLLKHIPILSRSTGRPEHDVLIQLKVVDKTNPKPDWKERNFTVLEATTAGSIPLSVVNFHSAS